MILQISERLIAQGRKPAIIKRIWKNPQKFYSQMYKTLKAFIRVFCVHLRTNLF